jgi:NADH-quinone oxidoreductase subunit J
MVHQVLAAASTHPGAGETAWFWLLAPVAFLAAIGLVASRSAVHAALFLAVDMLSLAVFYALEHASFLAFVQVIVYTGAIMMLFLFVLMLIGVDSSDSLVETLRGQRLAAALVGLGVVVLLIAVVGSSVQGEPVAGLARANAQGNVTGVAELLFSRYVIAFEATSALLITAGLGAMVLAHRERLVPKLTQRDLMRRRFGPGRDPSPLPGPGVFARGDAVDRAALLPDGSFASGSVAESLEPARTGSRVDEVEAEIDDPGHHGDVAAGSGGKKGPGGDRWT